MSDNSSDGSSYHHQPNGVTKNSKKKAITPHINDIVSGRGSGSNRHEGNLHFRNLIRENRELYLSRSKNEKMLVARDIYHSIEALDPAGRFLQKNPETGAWFEIGKVRALEKISQALREKNSRQRQQRQEPVQPLPSTGHMMRQLTVDPQAMSRPYYAGDQDDYTAATKSFSYAQQGAGLNSHRRQLTMKNHHSENDYIMAASSRSGHHTTRDPLDIYNVLMNPASPVHAKRYPNVSDQQTFLQFTQELRQARETLGGQYNHRPPHDHGDHRPSQPMAGLMPTIQEQLRCRHHASGNIGSNRNGMLSAAAGLECHPPIPPSSTVAGFQKQRLDQMIVEPPRFPPGDTGKPSWFYDALPLPPSIPSEIPQSSHQYQQQSQPFHNNARMPAFTSFTQREQQMLLSTRQNYLANSGNQLTAPTVPQPPHRQQQLMNHDVGGMTRHHQTIGNSYMPFSTPTHPRTASTNPPPLPSTFLVSPEEERQFFNASSVHHHGGNPCQELDRHNARFQEEEENSPLTNGGSSTQKRRQQSDTGGFVVVMNDKPHKKKKKRKKQHTQSSQEHTTVTKKIRKSNNSVSSKSSEDSLTSNNRDFNETNTSTRRTRTLSELSEESSRDICNARKNSNPGREDTRESFSSNEGDGNRKEGVESTNKIVVGLTNDPEDESRESKSPTAGLEALSEAALLLR
jgi:hypothetical protein